MGVLLTTIAGLVIWALGVKSFDAFIITIVMVVIASALSIVTPHLPGNRREG
jgi:hypothetical protein